MKISRASKSFLGLKSLLQWGALGLFMMSLGSCSVWNSQTNDEIVPRVAFGLRPVYFTGDDATEIYAEAPRPVLDGAGIVVLGTTILIIDKGTGIHVINNTDPLNPVPISFIRIVGVLTATADGNRLFANNLSDLVTIDITDFRNVSVIDRDQNLFPAPLDYPENYLGYFECYDPALGDLLRWEEATLNFPQCQIEI